ncbi:TatD family deoxyribonuclease [Verrucomicrobia bacterium S94]|nr:TatD family deoxyribonuclease [Verrucomicrobia bacterium S94]
MRVKIRIFFLWLSKFLVVEILPANKSRLIPGNNSRRPPAGSALLPRIIFIDSHVHFDRFEKDGTLDEILATAKEAGVHEMVAIGGSAEANARSARLAGEYPGRIFGCAGYDRDEATNEPDFSSLRELLEDPMVKAVGETGLDYYYTADTAAEQKKLFNENLALAVEFEKPVVVHSRDADEDTISLLRDFSEAWKGDELCRGVLHCFTRDEKFARAVLDLYKGSYKGSERLFNHTVSRDAVDILMIISHPVSPVVGLKFGTDRAVLIPGCGCGPALSPVLQAGSGTVRSRVLRPDAG